MGAHVEVQPGTIHQEHVGTSSPRDHLSKKVPGHLIGAQSTGSVDRAGDAVLVFDPVDPALHLDLAVQIRVKACSRQQAHEFVTLYAPEGTSTVAAGQDCDLKVISDQGAVRSSKGGYRGSDGTCQVGLP